MIKDELELDAMTANDLDDALALSMALKWPYRLADWQFLYELGEGLAVRNRGKVIGTAMRFTYGPRFATVGLIIVDPEYQGQKLGSRLLDRLIAGAGNRSILLNATLEGLALYQRRGFARVETTCQHQGIATPLDAHPAAANVEVATEADLPSVLELDRRASGMDREKLLTRLFAMGEVLVMRGTDHVPTGYSVARLFGRGHVIGPVVAPDADRARDLIAAQLAKLSGDFVRVDTTVSTGLSAWLERQGLAHVDSVEAMVRGEAPATDPDASIFALCSQSLG